MSVYINNFWISITNYRIKGVNILHKSVDEISRNNLSLPEAKRFKEVRIFGRLEKLKLKILTKQIINLDLILNQISNFHICNNFTQKYYHRIIFITHLPLYKQTQNILQKNMYIGYILENSQSLPNKRQLQKVHKMNKKKFGTLASISRNYFKFLEEFLPLIY